MWLFFWGSDQAPNLSLGGALRAFRIWGLNFERCGPAYHFDFFEKDKNAHLALEITNGVAIVGLETILLGTNFWDRFITSLFYLLTFRNTRTHRKSILAFSTYSLRLKSLLVHVGLKCWCHCFSAIALLLLHWSIQQSETGTHGKKPKSK